MESSVLIRTGSGRFHFPSTPAKHRHHHHDLPVPCRTRSAYVAGFYSRSTTTIHLEMRVRHDPRGVPLPNTLRRAVSCDSAAASFFSQGHTVSPSADRLAGRSVSSYTAKSALVDDEVELEFSGGGAGGRNRVGGGRRPGGGSGDHNTGMGAYYKEMLQADPENPLLLMNYGKYLHQVQSDPQGAEDCFGRAVLASPTDGEALSLYGNLMWEAHRDEHRADDYFQRAVQAAPDDCYVLGSYARFLWDTDEEDDSNSPAPKGAGTIPLTVEAY